VAWLAAPAFPQPAVQTLPPVEVPTPADRETRPPVDVTGATEMEYDAQTEQFRFRGPQVVVVRGTQRLTAPEIFYDASARRAVLPRGGTLSTPTMELSADRITADLPSRHFLAEGNVAGRLLDEGVWARLSAALLVADDRPDLRRAEASGNVVVTRNDEELRGDRVVYDRLTRRGTVEGNAVLTRASDRLSADRITVHLDRNEVLADGHARIVAHPREGPQGAQP